MSVGGIAVGAKSPHPGSAKLAKRAARAIRASLSWPSYLKSLHWSDFALGTARSPTEAEGKQEPELQTFVGGKDKNEMVPLSDSTFSITGVRIEFTPDRVIFHLLDEPVPALADPFPADDPLPGAYEHPWARRRGSRA